MVVSSSPRRLTSLLLAAALGTTGIDLVGLGALGHGTVWAQRRGTMQLSLRRKTDALDVVIQGVGEKPVLQQRLNGLIWEARLRTKGKPGLLRGPQTLSLPELGIESVSLLGGGDSYRIVVTSMDGQRLDDPTVSADGRNLILTFAGLGTPQLQTGRLDLNTPGRVPQPRYAPPLRPRAVAPPLGDMAVGTMVLQNRSFVNVSGPPVTLTLNNAPAKDALLAMARLGGYGFVYMDDSQQSTSSSSSSGGGAARSVTMTFANESYARALNSLLLASGLQGKLDGRTLLVGSTVSGKTFGPQISKVYRLNQASASSAADYLASLGAQISKINTTSITTGAPAAAGTSQISAEVSQTKSTLTNVETYGSAVGPLRGLTGTTDSRLQTITLVGDSQLVAVAEGYLKQIDLRQRQVAVKVQILNIDLTNDADIDASFSARLGNTFIVSENGRAFMNFGDYKPGGSNGTGRYDVNPAEPKPDYNTPGKYSTQTNTGSTTSSGSSAGNVGGDPASQQGQVNSNETGLPFEYAQDSVYGYLQAAIVSTNAKTLAQPTLLVQEGEEAEVVTGTEVVTSVKSTDTANGSTQFETVKSNAGLTLKVNVHKIDDNGFISLDIAPTISVPILSGATTEGGIPVYNISGRSLNSGKIRLRDRQTLVLTGVIQEEDYREATKWPILGDIPIIGQLFRGSFNKRQKKELVILVTPAIVDDERGGSYGYGYRPATKDARQLMRSRL